MPLGRTVRPPLTVAVDGTDDDLAGSIAFSSAATMPALSLVARQDGVAEAVFQATQSLRNEIADLNFQFAWSFLNSSIGMKAPDLRPAVNDHEVVVETNDFSGNDVARTHVLA